VIRFFSSSSYSTANNNSNNIWKGKWNKSNSYAFTFSQPDRYT
jgi:hypothetical protein